MNCFAVIFLEVFIFSMPSRVIFIEKQFIFLGINIFWPFSELIKTYFINTTVLFYILTTPWPVLAYFYGTGINGISHIVCKP